MSMSAKRRWWTRDEAVASARVADRDAARLDAAAAARAAVAGFLFGAAAIHFGLAPAHFGESRFHGAFFFLSGWLQLGLGMALLLRPSRSVLRAVIVVNVVLLLLWAVSRVTGMPFGDTPWVPESVGYPDVLAVVLEALAVTVGYLLLTARLGARTVGRAVAVAGGAVLATVLVGLTTASVAPALAGAHSHGAAGHAHAAVGTGHIHTVAGVTPALVAAGTSGGAGGSGSGHTHAAAAGAAAGIETASGASPCEQSGASVDGNGAGGHGHHGPQVQQAITDPATRARLADQLAQARVAAMQYPTAADATAAGYRRVTTYLPCIAAHYMKFSLVDATFDPSAPEMLLYDGNGPDARIVGLSYYVTGLTAAPEGFAGPNDPWHQHFGLCVRGGLVVGAGSLTDDECAARGGVKADGSTSWMVHAWVVPGWESAWGTFSAEHPELGKSVPH